MVIRQAFPFSLGAARRRAVSPIAVAVGFSIAAHVAIGAYVAMMKFSGPPPLILEEPPIWEIPFIRKVPPPPPQPDRPQKTRPQQPTIHESVPNPQPDVTPAPIAKPENISPPLGPVANLDLTPQVTAPPPRNPIIRDPQWVRRPDAGDFARFYPERAMRLGREGEAEITCSVLASGQLRDCRVSGEAPDNMGFGAAALKLARFLQIAPKTIDGKPVDGGILVVPITFRLG